VQSAHYDAATTAYNATDYPRALKGYYQCLKEDWGSFAPGDAGLVYHRIGNCLIKMRSFKEAAVSYQKALQDDEYPDKTGIYVNLGTTLNGIGKHTEAITYFNKALSDASYATPYRAYMGLGSAYTKLGKYVEAGTAYRDAALDEANPNPVKALLNLAASFTTLERPDDAAEAYLAILDFRVTGETLNTTLERLGQAYVAAGRYQEGLETFEELLARERFTLTPAGDADYQKARRALGLIAADANEPAVAEGAAATAAAGFAGDAAEQDDSFAGFELRDQTAVSSDGQYPAVEFDEEDGYGGGNVPNPGDTGFFTVTDDDLIASSKRAMRKERKLRHTGLKVFLSIVVLLVVALGTSVAAYYQGVGIPSQEATVTDFFKAHASGEPVEVVKGYWVANTDEDEATLKRLLDGIARSSEVTIISIESTMRESQVLLSAKLPEGGTVNYRVELARNFVGWKISGIDMVFASSPDSSLTLSS
jgi:tetratricopeptide (TPR) repeat protein